MLHLPYDSFGGLDSSRLGAYEFTNQEILCFLHSQYLTYSVAKYSL
jgi:hypothetical protein